MSVGEVLQRRVVVAVAGQVRVRKPAENLLREARHRNRRARRIHGAGPRIADVHGHDSLPLQRRRRYVGEPGDLARLPEALVVAEEERPVLDDRAADDAAELVAVERRLVRAAGGLKNPVAFIDVSRRNSQALPDSRLEPLR